MPSIPLARTIALATLALSLAACGDDETTTPAPERWSASLNGASEVPPVTTTATGAASFEAVGDTAISYSITLNGITGVTMGHIHTGAAGVNGGVMVWLLPPNGSAAQAPSGAINGAAASGRITQAWIRGVGGQPAISLDSLKRLMRSGNAYVNVHTSAFGGGEVRGQIRN
jgi:hypothetical protein